MSHNAVNWALEQTGLKPAAKLVLICLADRHNKDTGDCFPSQELLASDACVSRSSLNDQLNTLMALGLIQRHPEIDPVTKRQLRTNYTFNAPFAQAKAVSEIPTRAVSETGQKPCPKNTESRVRISDTNPVREPKRKPPKAREAAQEEVFKFSDEFWADLLGALNLDPAALGKWWSGPSARQHVAGWLNLGLSEAEILAVARKSRLKQPKAPDGPKALDAVMAAAASAPKPSAPATQDQITVFWAEKLLSDAFVPTSAISIALADELIRSGMVSAATLRARGIFYSDVADMAVPRPL